MYVRDGSTLDSVIAILPQRETHSGHSGEGREAYSTSDRDPSPFGERSEMRNEMRAGGGLLVMGMHGDVY